MQNITQNITIVGAGLVGTLLSVYLARAGFKVQVYERNSDPRKINLQSGRSINITLSERGFKALDAVGAGDIIRKFCIPIYGRIIHAADGSITYQPYGNHKEAIYSIARDDLTKELLNFAQNHENIEFYFNEKCADVDLATATLTLQNLITGNTRQVQCDRIFAADGANSAVRNKMQRLKRFNYSQEFSEQGYKEIIIPPNIHGDWQLKQNAIHIWPRDSFMLIGFPNIDKSFTLSLQLPYEGEISHNSISSLDALEDLFNTYFPDIWHLVKPNSTDYFQKSVEAMITIKCFPWTFKDKVALIGDACHAIFPSYGQGANAGFEDCQVLTQCIEKYPDQWRQIFQEYETQRKPNLDAIADLCFEHFTELRKMVGDTKFLQKKQMERKLEEIDPSFTSLYHNISFTSMPYLEALKIERAHQEMLDKLVQLSDARSKQCACLY